MKQNKLDLLNKVIKEERIYTIKIYRILASIYLVVKNRNEKILKPYYVFSIDKRNYTKKYMLYYKNKRFEYSEYELYAYLKGFNVLGKRFYKSIYNERNFLK